MAVDFWQRSVADYPTEAPELSQDSIRPILLLISADDRCLRGGYDSRLCDKRRRKYSDPLQYRSRDNHKVTRTVEADQAPRRGNVKWRRLESSRLRSLED